MVVLTAAKFRVERLLLPIIVQPETYSLFDLLRVRSHPTIVQLMSSGWMEADPHAGGAFTSTYL